MITNEQLFGLSDAHVTHSGFGEFHLHPDVIAPFTQLKAAAEKRNIGCDIASSFRSFHRQLAIWERKWRGELPLRDKTGNLLDAAELSDNEKVDAILAWSALPGASRHHWGCDIDVYDKNAVAEAGSHFQLVAEEYAKGGPCAALSEFLDGHLAQFDFFRPYAQNNSGVAREPWHISYRPVAESFASALTPQRYFAFLSSLQFSGKKCIIERFDEIFNRFVLNKGVT